MVTVDPQVFGCSVCRAEIATEYDLMSVRFNGRTGPAYLIKTAINVTEGPTETVMMTTGSHDIRDIRCSGCDQQLGWKYVGAEEEAQKYKEQTYVLDKSGLTLLEKAGHQSSIVDASQPA